MKISKANVSRPLSREEWTKKYPKLAKRLRSLRATASIYLSADAGRFGIHEYSRKVYRAVLVWQKRGTSEQRLKQLRRLKGFKIRRDVRVASALIHVTSDLPPKVRSRLSLTMSRAAASGIKPEDLRKFSRKKINQA